MYLIRDHYKALRVKHDAQPHEIEAAFRESMKKLASMNRYQAAFARLYGRDIEALQCAYEVLINPERRARFDKEWNDYPAITPNF